MNEMSWTPSTINVLPEEFARIVANHSIAIFHFWASWNRWDRSMDQLLVEIATEYGEQIFIGSVNYDDPRNMGKCRELRVINLPALALFLNGKHLETVIGLPSKQSLNRRLEECLKATRGAG